MSATGAPAHIVQYMTPQPQTSEYPQALLDIPMMSYQADILASLTSPQRWRNPNLCACRVLYDCGRAPVWRVSAPDNRHIPPERRTERTRRVTASLQSRNLSGVGLRASVVIPTYNRRSSLERVLLALGRQTLAASDFEVVVVADGCTDGTPAMCHALAPELPYALRIVEQANAGTAAARNRALKEARADLIVFVDDDVVPDERLLETHVGAHAPDVSDAVVAMGPLLPPLDTRLNAWGAWEERTLCSHYDAMQHGRWKPTYRQFYTGNASVAKRHLLAAGGFDHTYLRAEDIELGKRMGELGCEFVFLPEARGWHYVHRRFESWAAMPVAYGRAVVAMARTHDVAELATAAFEYQFRNLPVKSITHFCLGSRVRVDWATALLHYSAVVAWALHLNIVAYGSCSLLYNMRLYSGLAAELGSVDDFWRLIKAGRFEHGDKTAWQLLVALAARLLSAAGQTAEPVEVGI